MPSPAAHARRASGPNVTQHGLQRRPTAAVAAEEGIEPLAVREVQPPAGEQELAPGRRHRIEDVDLDALLHQRFGGHQPRAGADDDRQAFAAMAGRRWVVVHGRTDCGSASERPRS